MPARARSVAVGLALVVGVAACRPSAPHPEPSGGSGAPGTAVEAPWALEVVGRYDSGLGAGATEIVAFGGTTMVTVNALDNTVDLVDLSDPASPVLAGRVDMSPYGGGVNSVDVHGRTVVAAVEAEVKTDPGQIVFLDLDGAVIDTAPAGALPDMVTFSPDGRYVVVANEGEPSDDYSIDPEGSVTVVTTRPGADGLRRPARVRQVGFRAFDEGAWRHGQIDQGVRVFGPGASVSQDLEPEYVAVSPSAGVAYVTLQENNAVATVHLATGAVVRIDSLTARDYVKGDGLDPSDRDDAIAIANHPVIGLPMPDAIAALETGGRRYYVTANEGDAREWGDFEEPVRIGDDDYVLDPTDFPDAEELKEDDVLGRLNATIASGDTDGDGDVDRITTFGTRSFSIWDARTGRRVFDSGADFERITAAANPEFFNSNNDADNFDSRSDDKGPEPEAVTVGEVDGRTYAFVGLERVGGIAVYDVTNPASARFVQYTNPRTFDGSVGPDSGPEGLELVPAAAAPGGRPLLLVSNEVTGTVTVYRAVLQA